MTAVRDRAVMKPASRANAFKRPRDRCRIRPRIGASGEDFAAGAVATGPAAAHRARARRGAGTTRSARR